MCPVVSCLSLYSTLLEYWIRISFLDHKSFSYLILSMTISSCLLFFLLLCMRALSPFSPFVRLTCPVRWYQLVPHKPFGTLLAGVSATGSNDPAGSTGTRPTFVLYMSVNSCRMSIRINKKKLKKDQELIEKKKKKLNILK